MILKGKIELKTAFEEYYGTPVLVDSEGNCMCVLFRVQELVMSGKKSLTVRYWITDTETSFDDAKEGAVRTILGAPVADMEANSYSYSEYTYGVDYETELKIGGHDLGNELCGNKGKYAWIEIS